MLAEIGHLIYLGVRLRKATMNGLQEKNMKGRKLWLSECKALGKGIDISFRETNKRKPFQLIP